VTGDIYFAICVDNVSDKEKPGETKELLKYDTHGSITIMPTADDNGMDYTCEASHPAIPIDRPMRATITLSVFCKYDNVLYLLQKHASASSFMSWRVILIYCREKHALYEIRIRINIIESTLISNSAVFKDVLDV